MQKLKQIYDELGDNVRPFLLLYDKMMENNYSIEQITDAVNFADSLPQVEERYHALNRETATLESKKLKLAVSVTMLKNQIDEANRGLEFYRNEYEMKMKELSALNSEVNAKKSFIQNFDQEGYMRIKKQQENKQNFYCKINAKY